MKTKTLALVAGIMAFCSSSFGQLLIDIVSCTDHRLEIRVRGYGYAGNDQFENSPGQDDTKRVQLFAVSDGTGRFVARVIWWDTQQNWIVDDTFEWRPFTIAPRDFEGASYWLNRGQVWEWHYVYTR